MDDQGEAGQGLAQLRAEMGASLPPRARLSEGQLSARPAPPPLCALQVQCWELSNVLQSQAMQAAEPIHLTDYEAQARGAGCRTTDGAGPQLTGTASLS